jgi:carbon-monoxide dehydrogenase medium subunit
VKPPPFPYFDLKILDEALDLVATKENSKLLAGEQSLMPMLNMRYVQPDHVIDLDRIPGLNQIRGGRSVLSIGAMTRQRDLEFSPVVRECCPLMHEALLNVGMSMAVLLDVDEDRNVRRASVAVSGLTREAAASTRTSWP